MNTNVKLSEQLAVLDAIDPASLGTGATTTDWVDASPFHQVLALIQTGVLGTAATVDVKFQQATDASGTGAKDVAGRAITQIVKATGDNKQALLELRGSDLDVNGGFRYVRLSVTVGTAASFASAFLLGGGARYEPTPQATSVAQVA